MFTVRHTAKLRFFSDKDVAKRLRSGWRKRAMRWGAWTRLAARHSMRRRKGPAPPGQPPHAHTGLLREHIYFAWEPGPAWGNVVVGPIRLSGFRGDVPKLHEYGGTKSYIRDGKRVLAVFPARPFMRLAAQYARDKFWRTYRQVWA